MSVPVVLTPPSYADDAPSVVLTPNGGTAVELVGTGSDPDPTILLAGDGNETLFPVPEYEETYAFSPDTEGGFRTRSRPTIILGQGKVYLFGQDEGDIATLEYQWEKVIEDCRLYGGTLYVAPLEGQAVTYQVTSARLLTETYKPPDRKRGIAESTFELSFQPYGLLAEASVAEGSGTTPLVTFIVPELDGSVDALATLIVTDEESEDRLHVEGGLESRYYTGAGGWSLFIDSDEMTALDGATSGIGGGGGTPYGGNAKIQTLDTGSTGIASVTGTHVGRFRVKGRFVGDAAGISVQLQTAIRGSTASERPWQTLPIEDGWCEVDLGLVTLDPPPEGDQSVEFSVYGKAASGTPELRLDYLKIIPAERYFKAHGQVGSLATVRANSEIRIRHDGIFSETATNVYARHPAATGAGLRIPRRGGRIAVAMNRNDLEDDEHTPLGDSLAAELVVTPRVPLRGAVPP